MIREVPFKFLTGCIGQKVFGNFLLLLVDSEALIKDKCEPTPGEFSLLRFFPIHIFFLLKFPNVIFQGRKGATVFLFLRNRKNMSHFCFLL
ncbi:hypothetical protein ACFY4F_04675 [Peribacillus butanolivorans]|uniref:hypothetical protein n=1 Tax=Peribacillus butanolivorans TaxID=421767 RepID=UPI0036B7B82C